MLRPHEIFEDANRDTLSGEDEYGSGTALASLTADVAADRVLVPAGRREQPLHPVWRLLAGVLSERPASLALQPRQHPGHASPGPDPDLPPEEPARDQCERIVKPGSQPGRLDPVYPGQHCHPGVLSPSTQASARGA